MRSLCASCKSGLLAKVKALDQHYKGRGSKGQYQVGSKSMLVFFLSKLTSGDFFFPHAHLVIHQPVFLHEIAILD